MSQTEKHGEEPNSKASSVEQPRLSRRERLVHTVEDSVRSERRGRFIKMLLVPTILGLLFIVGVFAAHDLFVKHEYLKNMQKIGEQIKAYQKVHNNQLPSQKEFFEFNISTRNMRIENIEYDKSMILETSPPKTILACAPEFKSRFLPDGYWVLYLDGEIGWVSPQIKEKLMAERLQEYNTAVLREKP